MSRCCCSTIPNMCDRSVPCDCRPLPALTQTAAVLMTVHIWTPLRHLNFKDPSEEVSVSVWESPFGCFFKRSGGLKQADSLLSPSKFSRNPKAFYLSHNGSVYRQDVAAHHQQFGVPACSQCCRQEGFPHGGHGLFLHNVLHSGKRMEAFLDVYWRTVFSILTWKKHGEIYCTMDFISAAYTSLISNDIVMFKGMFTENAVLHLKTE